MRFRRQRREEVSINLTPLIDVVFLLLIFFMVTTTFTKETRLTVDLPEAQGVAQQEKPDQVEITIRAQGSFAVNGQSLANHEPDYLKAALIEVSDGDSSLPLVITADAMTPHQAVVTAMDVAGQLRFLHLSITTRQPAAE